MLHHSYRLGFQAALRTARPECACSAPKPTQHAPVYTRCLWTTTGAGQWSHVLTLSGACSHRERTRASCTHAMVPCAVTQGFRPGCLGDTAAPLAHCAHCSAAHCDAACSSTVATFDHCCPLLTAMLLTAMRPAPTRLQALITLAPGHSATCKPFNLKDGRALYCVGAALAKCNNAAQLCSTVLHLVRCCCLVSGSMPLLLPHEWLNAAVAAS